MRLFRNLWMTWVGGSIHYSLYSLWSIHYSVPGKQCIILYQTMCWFYLLLHTKCHILKHSFLLSFYFSLSSMGLLVWVPWKPALEKDDIGKPWCCFYSNCLCFETTGKSNVHVLLRHVLKKSTVRVHDRPARYKGIQRNCICAYCIQSNCGLKYWAWKMLASGWSGHVLQGQWNCQNWDKLL